MDKSTKRAAALTRWVFPPESEPSLQESDPTLARIIPELCRIGHQKYTEAFQIPLHRHEHAYEFVYLQNGSVTWEIDGTLFPMSAGQWFYTRPGELHKARYDYMEPSQIWWVIINDPENDPNWFRLNEAEREIIISRFHRLPRIFQGDPRTHERFAHLKTTLNSDSPDHLLFARYQLMDIILRLLQPVTTKKVEPELRETIIRTVQEMTQSPEMRFSVADMAEAVRVSESYYFKLFNEIFGQSPSTYMDRIRIERACTLLKTGISVTETALELGFKTSQHFTRVFKKIIGSSPSEWRKMVSDN
ncbi:AraC family transcriptional regulator [Paenibacillus roseipurpureus]|uniref:AraC family transcriptional regulator n=1 Tax=Paenibacillus roseopurpureus TaxID=2918901 RepID=A0AA96LS41_9BACL|nr:AraC family transcriptional regulator [Paenibacillus sp. MBLB1832]WNR44893.1 AraC family transcriptional regulator [Paenibacillus sp. MBLB1832]